MESSQLKKLLATLMKLDCSSLTSVHHLKQEKDLSHFKLTFYGNCARSILDNYFKDNGWVNLRGYFVTGSFDNPTIASVEQHSLDNYIITVYSDIELHAADFNYLPGLGETREPTTAREKIDSADWIPSRNFNIKVKADSIRFLTGNDSGIVKEQLDHLEFPGIDTRDIYLLSSPDSEIAAEIQHLRFGSFGYREDITVTFFSKRPVTIVEFENYTKKILGSMTLLNAKSIDYERFKADPEEANIIEAAIKQITLYETRQVEVTARGGTVKSTQTVLNENSVGVKTNKPNIINPEPKPIPKLEGRPLETGDYILIAFLALIGMVVLFK